MGQLPRTYERLKLARHNVLGGGTLDSRIRYFKDRGSEVSVNGMIKLLGGTDIRHNAESRC
jgi:hypothetical protein